jgi:hypothetical protein
MSRLPYGLAFNGIKIVPEPREAKVIQLIYNTYLTGTPLAGIVDLLYKENIPSPSGKERWSTAVLHKMLGDSQYIPVVSFKKYTAVQFELDKRANYDLVTGKRKTARYHSQNVLSGLFVCAECGRNYRRVQRASGEIVWRCANRVEHGSRICKSSPTITEEEAIRFVCEITGTAQLEDQAIKQSLESVIVNQDGSLTPERLFVSPDLTIQ